MSKRPWGRHSSHKQGTLKSLLVREVLTCSVDSLGMSRSSYRLLPDCDNLYFMYENTSIKLRTMKLSLKFPMVDNSASRILFKKKLFKNA